MITRSFPMAQLDKLNFDVLSSILLQVHDSSRHSIFSVILVNKALSEAALPFVYRHCTFDFASSELDATQERLDALLQLPPSAFVFTVMRAITVKTNYSYYDYNRPANPTDEEISRKWDPLSQLIGRVVHLHEFNFECKEPLPLILLKTLHNSHPTVHLHVRNWTRIQSDVTVGDPAEETLANSPCLRSLEASFVTGRGGIDLNLPAFLRIVTLAPHIQRVEFSTRSAGGCCLPPYISEQIERKKREAKKFEVTLPAPKALDELRWDYLTSRQIEHWGRNLDLGSLRTLAVSTLTPDALEYATVNSTFKSLTSLSLKAHKRYGDTENTFGRALIGFLSSCNPLECLSIVDYSDADITLLFLCLHHGQSLRSLALHNVESPERERQTFTPEDLTFLHKMVPNLQSLEIDINRTITREPMDAIYTALASFHNLSKLTLHYDLGLSDIDRLEKTSEAYPIVGKAFGEEVWHAIQDRKSSPASLRLEQLTLYIGEPDRKIGFGYPAFWVLDEQAKRQQLYVIRKERDDVRDQVHVRVEGQYSRR